MWTRGASLFCETDYFRDFMTTVQPKFESIGSKKFRKLVENEASVRDEDFIRMLQRSECRPSPTLDCWTAQNFSTYLGWTAHFSADGQLRRFVFFLKKLKPPSQCRTNQICVWCSTRHFPNYTIQSDHWQCFVYEESLRRERTHSWQWWF